MPDRRCESCQEHHHQGCVDTLAAKKGPDSCQCACRPVDWKK